MKRLIITGFMGWILAFAACLSLAQDLPYSQVTNKGAVATADPLATQAAIEALQEGGNAIDAAVTAALTLGVVNGFNSGIGGGCFALIHWADGRIEAIDGREMAPAAATEDMFLQDGTIIPEASTTGALAVGVPGSLATYDYLLQQGGNRTLSQALQPGIYWAEQGIELNTRYVERIRSQVPQIARFPAARDLLLDENGEALTEGDHLVQPDLAETYRQLAEQGIDYFYGGDFAQAVANWMKQNGGIVTTDDFADYQLKQREPVVSSYRGYQVYGFPPPSSGGVHVAQILNILEGWDVSQLTQVQRLHLLAEAMKLAFADRAYWLGDSDFVDVPRGLIDKSYANDLAARIDLNKTVVVPDHGVPPGSDTDLFGKHTTHIAVADAEGNWVSITTTVNTSFGSKVVVPGTGVFLNNQMDDFSKEPGVPNAFGLVGADANKIEPGKRPLSSMSPTLVLKDGQPVMVVGAAGGPTIITQVVQALVNHLDLGLSLQESLAAIRLHHQWQPDTLFVENTMPEELQQALGELGHVLRQRTYTGESMAVGLDKQGQLSAVSEPRISQTEDQPDRI